MPSPPTKPEMGITSVISRGSGLFKYQLSARAVPYRLSGARVVTTTSVWIEINDRRRVGPELVAGMLDHSFGEDARAPQVLGIGRIEPLLNSTHQNAAVGGVLIASALTLPYQPYTGVVLHDDRVISVAPGSPADLVVLSADPVETPAEAVERIQVLSTYWGGNEVYRSGREPTSV